MTKLKLGPLPDDKPVKVMLELHQDCGRNARARMPSGNSGSEEAASISSGRDCISIDMLWLRPAQ